jgi:hypothetical protein
MHISRFWKKLTHLINCNTANLLQYCDTEKNPRYPTRSQYHGQGPPWWLALSKWVYNSPYSHGEYYPMHTSVESIPCPLNCRTLLDPRNTQERERTHGETHGEKHYSRNTQEILEWLLHIDIFRKKPMEKSITDVDLSQTPTSQNSKRERERISRIVERSCRAPCVVLVINDNLYGLMVALSYMCRTCP